MDTTLQIRKRALKVYVQMHDGSRLVGAFYMAEGERLQDIMNDERSFLPLYLDGKKDHNSIAMVSKRYIQQVEEIANLQVKTDIATPSDNNTQTANDQKPSTHHHNLELE